MMPCGKNYNMGQRGASWLLRVPLAFLRLWELSRATRRQAWISTTELCFVISISSFQDGDGWDG
jgi:hypothetical protein